MMKIKNILIILGIGLASFSCTKDDGIFLEDHVTKYEIPLVPVQSDYIVGAHYSKFVLKATVTEKPAIGVYDGNVADKERYAKHVDQAKKGGIDYFLFGLSSTKTMTAYTPDTAFINTNLRATNAADLKFAISYSFSALALADNKRIETVPGAVTTFLKDFELMVPYFKRANYMKTDGKCVVYIQNGYNLYANDNKALYQQLRTQMTALGVELYLISNQNEWTPPMRYDFRFVGGVDAVTHSTYAQIGKDWYDRATNFFDYGDQAWMYAKETFAKLGIEYVPTIVPSYNPLINTPTGTFYVWPKNQKWFEDYCNVARRASGTKKLVLIDSFNDWNRDTQLEAATSYGEEYLTILKKQFKVN